MGFNRDHGIGFSYKSRLISNGAKIALGIPVPIEAIPVVLGYSTIFGNEEIN